MIRYVHFKRSNDTWDELKTTRSQRHDGIASSIIKVNMRGTVFEVEKIWNVVSCICEHTLSGHTSYVSFLFELFDGRICSGSFDDTIRLWIIDNGSFDLTLTGYTGRHMSIIQLKDGRICSAGLDGNIKMWSD